MVAIDVKAGYSYNYEMRFFIENAFKCMQLSEDCEAGDIIEDRYMVQDENSPLGFRGQFKKGHFVTALDLKFFAIVETDIEHDKPYLKKIKQSYTQIGGTKINTNVYSVDLK